ncbi:MULTISPECIES: CvpA family protein [unclassified Dinoroseobacter]|uniref:CvpA family protein n=1 Tax=unclassified Dinoroseobacter TaxID=2620028 RepID=UPI003C7C52E9
MDGFTLVDGIVAGVILVSALLAFSRGLVREVMAIAGWIAAAIVAFLFAGQAEPLLKELPYVGPILQDSCELAIIAAFAAVFAITLVVVSVFTPLFSGLIQRSALGGIDQGLGFFFGAVRGILLVAVGLLAYDRIMTTETIPMIEESRSASVFGAFSARLEAQIPEDATGWVVGRYEELVGNCGAPS